ncbi:acetyltransferase [Chelativorans sp. AA-79]|uniref:acetyltransferase n=1 Tax=Chelativorans sp. AA-79 TaxID=3028735 RepID=UPI0023F7B4A1|nr:acetyltransferase [Chelativorans sp. AA-79]WEX08343.1 acetyltransferase [Chelativorans sp. AA-79]
MPGDIPRGLYILGYGGHARSVADVALQIGIENLIFVDPNAAEAEAFGKFPVLRGLPGQIEDGWAMFPAIGDNGIRKAVSDDLMSKLITIVSPDASIGLQAEIGPGTFVGRHAHVGPFARIGMGVIVNTGAVIEHDCVVGDFSHVSVNATVAGNSRIGNNVIVGAGATVIDKIAICDDVIVGAGATVVRDIGRAGTYVGIPAKLS